MIKAKPDPASGVRMVVGCLKRAGAKHAHDTITRRLAKPPAHAKDTKP